MDQRKGRVVQRRKELVRCRTYDPAGKLMSNTTEVRFVTVRADGTMSIRLNGRDHIPVTRGRDGVPWYKVLRFRLERLSDLFGGPPQGGAS